MNDLWPVLVYEYDVNGRYHKPCVMQEEELQAFFLGHLRQILKEKRELRITDGGDNMCFHVQDGKILFDGTKHFPEGKPLPPERESDPNVN